MAGLQTSTIPPTQPQNTPTPTIFKTATPTQPIKTATPEINLPHALETPVGLKNKLVIHKVKAGESLPSIANIYGTTIEAIQAVNYLLPIPLMVDYYLIIPPNQTDVEGLPKFTAFQVNADIVVETLAQQLSVDPSLLKLYNGFKDGETIEKYEWLVVPH